MDRIYSHTFPNRSPRQIACAICGTPFESAHPRSKLCSNPCRAKRAAEQERKWVLRNRERLLARQREAYAENPGPAIARARTFNRSDRGREVQRKRSAVRRVTEAHKVRARTLLNCAVRDGRMTRGACRDCGSPDTHGHHPDYSKPLEVIWLCPPHHIAEHKRIDANG